MKPRALVTALALTIGCSATETGNPVAEQQLAFSALTSTPSVQLEPGERGTGLVVTEAWIVLGDVRFVPCDGQTERVDIPGPTTLELLSAPSPLLFELADRDYCRVRIPLDRGEDVSSGSNEALEDHSVVVMGLLADGTAFEVRSRDRREAELRTRDVPIRLGDAAAQLVLAFDIGAWLDGLDLASAERDDDGRIVVDDDTNREQLEQFERNVRQALELFRDRDEDGQLDDDERPTALMAGS